MLLRLLVTSLLSMFVSCGRQAKEINLDSEYSNGQEASEIAEREVLEIAKREVASIERTWSERAEYRVSMESGEWLVFVWKTPHHFGDSRYLRIDAKGNVIEYTFGK